MKLSELKINPNNPQKFDDLSKLKNSIKEFPKMMKLRPLVYDTLTGYILGGNKRLICLRELEFKEIPDEWVRSADELTEEEKQRFIIADNVGFGEFNWEILDNWDTELLSDWGIAQADISKINELDEWNKNDMPKFEIAENELFIKIIFKTEEQRETYRNEKKINITKKQNNQWICRL